MKYRFLLLSILLSFSLIFGLFYSCSKSPENPSATSLKMNAGFVGAQQCASCHADQFSDWQGSHHDYAMKEATDEFVRGNFNNVTIKHKNDTYRFFRDGERFMLEYGSDAGEKIYEITYTFGWEPLQQYLVKFDKGKLQALNIAWDTNRNQWFALNPEEDVQHGDWLHWTGGAMNWNTMCASCHSTNLQKNYIVSADSFHTTWSSINVSCESCHGPGKKHVDFMQSEKVEDAKIERIRKDLKLTGESSQLNQINQCAQCHSLREQITENHKHKDDFLNHFNPTLPHPESYFADGQIREEVYVYGSFLQSKMFQEGIKCNDCHDPHSLELKANVTDNTLCMTCHEPRYNRAEHHFHVPNTGASQCISCHMTGRFYMKVDFRRDHSFRVPRPDLSVQFGTPNACNKCHDSKSPEWAAKAFENWYGSDRSSHFSEILTQADSVGSKAMPELKKLISDTVQADIARATAVWYIGQFPSEESLEILEQAINDESPLVRKSVARALAGLPAEMKNLVLQDVLDDSVRSVRVAAAAGLAEFSASDMVGSLKPHFKFAMKEYRQYLKANQYFPQGQMNRGQYFEKRGQVDQAITAYKKALEKDPSFNAARLNLAYIYNGRGKNDQAENLLRAVIRQEPDHGPAYYSLALLLAEERRLTDALVHFQKAAALMPEHSRVRYNWAIALQTLNRPDEAEEAYLSAIKLEPENPAYRYGICTLFMQQNKPAQAEFHAEKLVQLLPSSSRAKQLLQSIRSKL